MTGREMPFYEFRPGIYEIDEYCCVSMFLIVGEEQALLIDTGVGIGDVRQVIRRITDKELIVAASHNHLDHIGGAFRFEKIYMHPADIDEKRTKDAADLKERRAYGHLITNREGKYFPYDPDTDIEEWNSMPEFVPMEDGHVFDLGGRTVQVFHCPGPTPGEVVFLDEKTKTLICGDAINCNWYLSQDLPGTDQERLMQASEGLKRILAMADRYDYVINSHHDYRGYGNPLKDDVPGNLSGCLEELVNGTAQFKEVKDPMSKTGGTRTVAYKGNVEVSLAAPSLSDDF